MRALEYINLKENDLTGEVPAEIADLVELTSLELQNNDLTGQIPNEICKAKYDNFILDCDEVECDCCKNQNCSG